MSKHRFLSAAFIGIAALALTTSAANAATTVPAVKAASPVTKAPAVVTPSVKAPVATKAPTLLPATKAATAAGGVMKKVKPVKVGNFCKKVLVGKTAIDGAGASVKCVANAKGQPVWTV